MKDLILVGGGNSIREGISKGLWEYIKNKDVWSLNFAYKFMPFRPKKEIWFDRSFFKNNHKEIEQLWESGVELYCRENSICNAYSMITQYKISRNIKKIKQEEKNKNKKFDTLFAGQMGLTGFLALSIAVKENYDRIFLLGYDFGTSSFTNKNTHFYQDEIKGKNIKSNGVNNPLVYRESEGDKVRSSVSDFEYYSEYYNKIFNVSLITNISNFKIISYDEFFKLIQEPVNEEEKETF